LILRLFSKFLSVVCLGFIRLGTTSLLLVMLVFTNMHRKYAPNILGILECCSRNTRILRVGKSAPLGVLRTALPRGKRTHAWPQFHSPLCRESNVLLLPSGKVSFRVTPSSTYHSLFSTSGLRYRDKNLTPFPLHSELEESDNSRLQ